MDAANAIAILVSSGVIAALITAAAQMIIALRKQGADAPGQLTESAMKIVNELQEEIARLTVKVAELEYKVAVLENDYSLALAELEMLDRSKAEKLRRDARGRFIARGAKDNNDE